MDGSTPLGSKCTAGCTPTDAMTAQKTGCDSDGNDGSDGNVGSVGQEECFVLSEGVERCFNFTSVVVGGYTIKKVFFVTSKGTERGGHDCCLSLLNREVQFILGFDYHTYTANPHRRVQRGGRFVNSRSQLLWKFMLNVQSIPMLRNILKVLSAASTFEICLPLTLLLPERTLC